MDKKKVKELLIKASGCYMDSVNMDCSYDENYVNKANSFVIEALKELERPDIINRKVYIVIERPLDTTTLTSDIGCIHVTSNAEKAIDYYQKGENCLIVTKEVEE